MKTLSLTHIFGTAVSAAVIGLLTANAAGAQAPGDRHHRSGCTNATLRGAYGYVAEGISLPGSPLVGALQGPFASSGVATFDGRGQFTLTATSSFNGIVVQPATVNGTYDVNDDCTYTSAADNGVTFRAVIVDGGDELLILQTTPGVVIAGTAAKRDRRRDVSELSGSGLRCNLSAITNGRYGFFANGVGGPPTIPRELAGPIKGVGTVAFGRRGTFTLIATRSVNGTLDAEPLTLTGTYTWAEACTFRMAFDVGFTFTGAVVDGGQELLFIETDPGTTLTVRARRQ